MSVTEVSSDPALDLASAIDASFGTILADPPWRFQNRTGRIAPEYRRNHRYQSLDFDEISALPVKELSLDNSHLYLWVPNALIQEGLEIMKKWGFEYKTNLVWYKVRKDGGPDGRGVGFYFRNVTELVLFGVRGNKRTLDAGRTQVNIIPTRKREHSRKPMSYTTLLKAVVPVLIWSCLRAILEKVGFNGAMALVTDRVATDIFQGAVA